MLIAEKRFDSSGTFLKLSFQGSNFILPGVFSNEESVGTFGFSLCSVFSKIRPFFDMGLPKKLGQKRMLKIEYRKSEKLVVSLFLDRNNAWNIFQMYFHP